jgi:hypothetical protein
VPPQAADDYRRYVYTDRITFAYRAAVRSATASLEKYKIGAP